MIETLDAVQPVERRAAPTSPFLPSDRFIGWLLEDALPRERCAELLDEVARRGFAETGEHYPRGYRDNDRRVFDDPELARLLYDELRDRLPAVLAVAGVRWEIAGLNPRFRACRYHDGQAFCIHRDGPYVPSEDLQSHLMLQFYLDEVPTEAGGRTRFYADAAGSELWAAIAPRLGRAIVFDHRAWHDGEAVTVGVKHVLRTDVMYRRAGTTPHAGAEREVIGRHRGYAWRVIACRDGSLASSGRDGTIRRWGAEPVSHDTGAGSVIALVEDAAGRLWGGTRSGALVRVDDGAITRVASDVGAVLAACALAEGGIVAATSRGTLLVCDPEPRPPLKIHDGWAWAVAPYGDAIASCGEDGRVVLTDRAGGSRQLASFPRCLRAIAALGRDLLVGDLQGWIHRLGPAGNLVAAWPAHTAAVTAITVIGEDEWATASEDGSVKRWRRGELIAMATSPDFVTGVALMPDSALACSGYDGSIWVAR